CDPVLPVAQGGRKHWENIVTCCVTCNRKKGGRTPAEAGMHLLRTPRRPDSAPAIRIKVGLRHAPESWRDYLYWNAELDDTYRAVIAPTRNSRLATCDLRLPTNDSRQRQSTLAFRAQSARHVRAA